MEGVLLCILNFSGKIKVIGNEEGEWQPAGVRKHREISTSKHTISGCQVSGVRFQVSGKRNVEAET